MQKSELILGEAELKLKPSEDDPWYEVEVERVLGCFYLKANSQMQPGDVVAEIESEEFEPYSYIKIDRYNK